ncbi:LysR family transcriptional regulator [Caulobacter sp. S45]|uniref:LysR family transcriptional regulator n=1 Tax=Caulobacter sp. S45 TaxID=1641861 RepID=UPI00131A8EC2|nr:LysR family transcriptional regulator [Caulobacter sp. S45]
MAFDGRLLSGVTVLAAVVESGSFTRAGELLGLSPSGVSRSVSRLEDRIGVRLLDRTTRALRLTDEGGRFYQMALPHLDGIEEAANLVSGAAEIVRGRLRASVNPIFAQHVIAPRLGEFIARFPDLEVDLLTPDGRLDLISEGVDVAIRFGQQPTSNLTSKLILETRVLTVASPTYLERRGRPGHPTELTDHACIQFRDPMTGQPFEWEFRRGKEVLPIPTRGQLVMSDPGTMVTACLAGAGVAQILAIGVQHLLDEGRLVELFPDWPGEIFPLYAVRPSKRLAPVKVEAFIDFCCALVR